MPAYFSQVFGNLSAPPAVKRNLDFSYRHMPMLNEVSTSLSSYMASQGQIARKKALMRWYKNTPELNAFINKVTNDTTSFYHFEPVGTASSGSGKNRVLKANRFALNESFRQTRAEIFSDCLITGDGFGWMGKISLDDVEKVMKEVMSKYSILEQKEVVPNISIEMKERIRKEVWEELKHTASHEVNDVSKFNDEDVLAPRMFKYVPSSTVEVVYDRYDIKGYNHFLGVYLPMFFSPSEIVHFTLMKRDGKVNGFTPLESIIVQLELLRQMWQNMLAMQMNGGAPDKIFNLKNLSISSPGFAKMQDQIAKYRLAENKHGNMLFAGDLQVIDMQQLENMQFKDMGLYITGLVAMQWGIPRSSIPFIVGGTNTKDDTGGNSERGYWQFIRGMQQLEAEIWNTQLWMPYFKVKLVPELNFPQLEIQEQQALMSKIQNIQNISQLVMDYKLIPSREKTMEVLGWTEEDFEEAPKEKLMAQQQQALGMGTPKTSPDKPNSDQGSGHAAAKRQEQQNSIASRGKPTGYGKELEDIKNTLMEIKTFMAKPLEKSPIHTQYENRVKLIGDQPISQFQDNNRSQVGKQDSALVTDTAGPSMPADWAIDKDNKIRPDGVPTNYKDKPMFSGPHLTPQVPAQKAFAPKGLINNENMYNPAGNINYPYPNEKDGDSAYVKGDDNDNHDSPQTSPKKVGGKYPTQRKYPDEHASLRSADEKESQLKKGMKVEEEHREVYNFINTVLKETGKLPPWESVKKHIVDDHLAEVEDYYTKLMQVED